MHDPLQKLSVASTTCELQWLSFLLRGLQITCSKQAVLYCDSQSSLRIAANVVFYECTKYLDIDCHVVRERLQQGLMKLLPLSSKDHMFSSFVLKLGMLNIF